MSAVLPQSSTLTLKRPNIYDDLRVRVATVDDMPEIMELAVAAAKENSLFDASLQHLVKTVWPCLNQDHGLIGAIGKPNGPIEGMVVLVVGTLTYSDVLCLEERTLFVRPEYRNARGGRANKLIQFSMASAKSLDLPLLIGVLSNSMTKQKVELYRRHLGEPAGAFWVWGAQTGGHSVGE